MLRGLTDDPGRELDQASVFLSTSAFEGQGLSIAEALVHGCPVVAYDVQYGPGDLLAQGGGMLVPDGDIEALAAALIEVVSDVELRARLTAEAVAAARVRCTPTTRWPRWRWPSKTCSRSRRAAPPADPRRGHRRGGSRPVLGLPARRAWRAVSTKTCRERDLGRQGR